MSIRCVHLDLKGLPPTESRLLSLPSVFAAAGYNAILVEWEDAFPWTVDLRLRSETAYSPQIVAGFHARARELGMEIIPLVQCLGHMETPLSLPDYAHLREVPDRSDCLNPLAPRARELVERMIDDVLSASVDRDSRPPKYFHIGGDEAWSFGSHPDTRAFIKKHGKPALFLHHVEPLLRKLASQGIRPLIWHDMMHDWNEVELARVAPLADVVAWGYQGHPDDAKGHFKTSVIERMHRAGMTIWCATAYKGADSAGDADLPDLAARIANARGWMAVHDRLELRGGLIATAWSRYSAHRVQCEPIDGALDAMVQVGAILNSGEPLSERTLQNVLRSCGELERFESCRRALASLSGARKRALYRASLLSEQIAVEQMDARRRGSGVLQTLENLADRALAVVESAARDVQKALSGLIEPIWIERYLAERLIPLRGLIPHK